MNTVIITSHLGVIKGKADKSAGTEGAPITVTQAAVVSRRGNL